MGYFLTVAPGGFGFVIHGFIATPATTAVPEPSTWAMLLLGFAGLGLAGGRAPRRGAAVAG